MAEALTGWQVYIPWRASFEEVIDPRFYSLAWLDDEIASGRARCWASDTAAIVATIRTYPAGAKEVHGLIAAGDMHGVIDLIPKAEEWGLQESCIVASVESRAAWTRALAQSDYSPYQVVLRKDLPGGAQFQQADTEVYA